MVRNNSFSIKDEVDLLNEKLIFSSNINLYKVKI